MKRRLLVVLALLAFVPLAACASGGGGDAPLETATWGESRFDEARWAE